MSEFDRLRRDFAILRLMADQQEELELERCAHADARIRVREISPIVAGQIWRRDDE